MPSDNDIGTVPPPRPDPKVLKPKPHPRDSLNQGQDFSRTSDEMVGIAAVLVGASAAVLVGATAAGAVGIVALDSNRTSSLQVQAGLPEHHLTHVVGRSSTQITDVSLPQGQFTCDDKSFSVRGTSCQSGVSVVVDYRCEVSKSGSDIYSTVSYGWDPDCVKSEQ